LTQYRLSIFVPFASDGKSVVNLPTKLQEVQEFGPGVFAVASAEESLGIFDHDDRIAGSGRQDIQALKRRHESNIAGCVAPGHAN
jgi:hypothetical protein